MRAGPTGACRSSLLVKRVRMPDSWALNQPNALRRFFVDFRKTSDQPGQSVRSKASLERFFADFARLKLALAEPPAQAASIYIDLARLRTFLATLRQVTAKLYRLGDFIDVWSVAGVNRVELRNAAVLAWLLDANGTHGLSLIHI